MKIAVYVEGNSELLFVADILAKYSSYNPKICGFRCINLISDSFNRLSSPCQGDETSEKFYQIVNVKNDATVISKLNKNIPGLIQQGFEVFIALRDAYSEAYRVLSKGERKYNQTLIEELHQKQTAVLSTKMQDIRLHFAIMEYESWMLALIENFLIANDYCIETLQKKLNIDLTGNIDQTFYHPASIIEKIYQFIEKNYGKHGHDTYSFLSTLTKDDYERLRNSGQSPSFTKFINSLLGGTCPTLP